MIRNKYPRFKLLVLLLTCITCNTVFAAEENRAETIIKILSYGIYAHSPDNGKSWINPISDKIIKGTNSSPVHLKSTRTIPAKFPLFFGFEYTLKNLKGQFAEISTEVSHPGIKQADGNLTTQYKQSQQFLIINNVINATSGFLLEGENEIQEGEWIFKIKVAGQVMTTQSFIVTKSK